MGDRCAVPVQLFAECGVNQTEALQLLRGFRVLAVDVVQEARSCIGTSQYQRGARPSLAPQVVDCSSLMKWIYARMGIWLPRRSIQQRAVGIRVDLSDARAGDLAFTAGYKNYFVSDPQDGVGHVGLLTSEQTVIHAANKKRGVIETSLADFVCGEIRGVVRIVPDWNELLVLETPPEREVEISDDVRWILLQGME